MLNKSVEPVTTEIAIPHWHALSAEEALLILETNPGDGLSAVQVQQRAKDYGKNLLPSPKRRSRVMRLLLQFHNMLIYILIAAGAITMVLGHWVDSAVIFGVIVVNACIGFIQEGKAESALEAIRQLLSVKALVLRDSCRQEIDAAQLLPGDIVYVRAGNKIPADLRLIDVHSLRVEEAMLTGESAPVDKMMQAVSLATPLAERHCMAYSGTLASYGQAMGVVVATGLNTEIGRISQLLSQLEPLSTPLLRKLAGFGQRLSIFILLLALFAFMFGVGIRHYALSEMFLAAVGIAVAAIPEGLPAIISITLAIGVQRMARRQAIIRQLPAVEALGSVTVICSDKTGTLTRNEMTVRRLLCTQGDYQISGTGYAPHGQVLQEQTAILPATQPLLLTIARTVLLCNDAILHQDTHGQWQLSGAPTEGALLTFALKLGLDSNIECKAWPRRDTIPFESEHRFMATLHHHQQQAFIGLKGAPEHILALCSNECHSTADKPINRLYWQQWVEQMAAQGMRVLAVATKQVSNTCCTLSMAHINEGGFSLLALLGLIDPAREEAIQAVTQCQQAGIAVKMITGDHIVTARAIGEQLKLGEPLIALSGNDIDALSDAQLEAQIPHIHVFARANPEHKLRIVRALQRHGAVVAMTGDGVNDAPALKCANVGVAMGLKGSETAKEAAEIVLADDNFTSIVAAVEEGRLVYDNICKSILFILPTNGGEAGMLLIAILFGMTLPMSAAQILWVNMITTVTLALAVAFEPAEANIMRRSPRDPDAPLLSRFLLWRVALVSLLLVLGGLGLFLWELSQGARLEVARTVAVNALVMGEIVYLLNVRRLTESVISVQGLFGNRYVLLAIAVLLFFQGMFTYLPSMHTLFATASLDLSAWLRISLFGLAMFLAIELEKRLWPCR